MGQVRFQTFESFHAKRNIGSTKIRVRNLIKYWPEAGLYKYGEKPDVLIFQKVYVCKSPAGKYALHETFDGIKILDICDPDWKHPSNWIVSTVKAVDAVVTSSQGLADFIKQFSDKPVRVIKDRFDLTEFPNKRKHKGKGKNLVWFGYSHNAELLRGVVFHAKKRNLKLTVISDLDPHVWDVIGDESFFKNYKFIKYDEDAYENIQKHDICVLPKGSRPEDRFKSENKTTIARLLGLPVATTPEHLDKYQDPDERNKEVDKWYNKTKDEYNVIRSIEEYKELINEIKSNKA